MMHDTESTPTPRPSAVETRRTDLGTEALRTRPARVGQGRNIWKAPATPCRFIAGTGTAHAFHGGARCECGQVASPHVIDGATSVITFGVSPETLAGNEAILRLKHVRDFLQRLDVLLPDGLPLYYADVIAEELAPLERAADVAMERRR
jgi:hypothetical protein